MVQGHRPSTRANHRHCQVQFGAPIIMVTSIRLDGGLWLTMSFEMEASQAFQFQAQAVHTAVTLNTHIGHQVASFIVPQY